MKKYLLKLALSIVFIISTNTNYAQITLHTEDLPRFFAAFDSVLTTKDTVQQDKFIQEIYVDKASPGLKKFMELRGGNTIAWRKFITNNTQSLIEKRPYILSVLNQEKTINKKINRFKKLYPAFRDGDIYFCVGINNSGGTIYDNTVYIGAEIAANSKPDWANSLVLHEFTHTQQWVQKNIKALETNENMLKEYENTHNLLIGKCIEEGMADFVGELANGESLAKTHPNGHTAFGLKNEKIIADLFKKDMFKNFEWKDGWLYSQKEINGEKISDLGYFMGYQICKSYYKKSKNKKLALSEMLNMNLTDENAKNFVENSGYFSEN
jgi:uncharacterized protein YjaZ